MGESVKAMSALGMFVGVIAAVIAWFTDRPDAITWGFRLGGPALALLGLGLILKLHFRADLAPDYLRDHFQRYFNRDGFCFALIGTEIEGIAYMDAYFQNQYDQPCFGRIAARPARGFLMGRVKIETIIFEIECAPGGFGFARIAIPIPQELQGKRQSFEVGAFVHFANGKGRRLRFHDGVFLRSDSDFGNSVGTALLVAGAATGAIVLKKPATTTVELPFGVAEDLPENLEPEIRTLWRLGDPPLE